MNRQTIFYIPGTPAPQPRPRMTRDGRAYNPPSADTWKASVRKAWTDSGGEPFTGALRMRLEFILPRPAGHWRKTGGLVKSAPADHISKPDTDNLAKAVMDALENAGAFRNDSAVIALHLSKRYAAEAEYSGCRATLTERDL